MAASRRSIGVLFGGPSPEHDVSVLTGLQAVRGLGSVVGVVQVHALFWSKIGTWHLVPSDAEAAAFAAGAPDHSTPLEFLTGPGGGFVSRKGRIGSRTEALDLDAVIVCCHGGPGEDGTLQGALELAGISYSGPSRNGAAIGMDKLASAAIVVAANIPTLARVSLHADSGEPDFPGPYIVKPRFGGSSIGIDVVKDFATARARLSANVHLRRGAVLEPYRPDLFDLQIGVRSWPELNFSAIERPIRQTSSGDILGYADKYVGGEGMVSAPRELPAELPDAFADQLRHYARVAARCLDARGVARIDFLSDGEQLFLNEINTIPGSLARHLFVEPEVRFADLLSGLVDEALTDRRDEFSTAGADGTVLKLSGSIASKLA